MNKAQEVLKFAYNKGYYVTDMGEVYSPTGKKRKLQLKCDKRNKDKRFIFNISFENKRRPVKVHRLLAYQLFGDKIFTKGLQVRHLDGNSLNNTLNNLALGTASQNMLDRPKEDRLAHACLARLYRKDLIYWPPVDNDRKNGMSYRKLAKKYNISKGNFSRRYAGKLSPIANVTA